MSVPHPALLGTTAQHMPLLSAAVHVAGIRAPQVVYTELVAIAKGGGTRAYVEFRRAMEWIAGKCAEPNGLSYFFQDPATGNLQRLSPAALWQADADGGVSIGAEVTEDPNTWPELQPFRQALRDVVSEECDPALQVVVFRPELDAHLGPTPQLADLWVAKHYEEVMQQIQLAVGGEAGVRVPGWLLSFVEHQMPMQLELRSLLSRIGADPPNETARPKVTTKAAVAAKEAEFRRRWRAKEFSTADEARRVLVDELNARPDGTVAKRGDRDFRSPRTVDRLTRGWFA